MQSENHKDADFSQFLLYLHALYKCDINVTGCYIN